MKYLIIFLLIFLTLFSDANAQGRVISGEVIDVIDGRTFILKGSQASYTVRLQFVDTPESTQQLFETVKGHLSSQVMNKNVTLQLRLISGSVYVGKVVLDGVDLGMQLLRDGAAWYSVPEAQFHADQERAEYLEVEKLAKAEKLGVWGIESLRPAYELRLEREKVEKVRLEAEQKAFADKIVRQGMPTAPTIGMTQTEFTFVCGAHPRDSISVTDTVKGRTVFIILHKTADRIQNMCFGSFNFGDGKLDYINRTNY